MKKTKVDPEKNKKWKVNFGKHVGQTLETLPGSFIVWGVTNLIQSNKPACERFLIEARRRGYRV